MKTVIVIPARLESTRLPRKLLLDRTGKTLIEHTFESALESQMADQVVVATDSQEIATVISDAGGTAILTSPDHQSGTDRIAEAIASIDAEIVINVQGDEPEIDGKSIDLLVEILQINAQCSIATLATPLKTVDQYLDPACVKVVVDLSGKALYFSRSPVPASRDPSKLEMWMQSSPNAFLQHIGIYAYRRDCLLKFASLQTTALENIESLEQLRLLENGWSILVGIVDHHATGIDTPEDYDQFVNRWTNR